jgi:hypothetical protein
MWYVIWGLWLVRCHRQPLCAAWRSCCGSWREPWSLHSSPLARVISSHLLVRLQGKLESACQNAHAIAQIFTPRRQQSATGGKRQLAQLLVLPNPAVARRARISKTNSCLSRTLGACQQLKGPGHDHAVERNGVSQKSLLMTLAIRFHCNCSA